MMVTENRNRMNKVIEIFKNNLHMLKPVFASNLLRNKDVLSSLEHKMCLKLTRSWGKNSTKFHLMNAMANQRRCD